MSWQAGRRRGLHRKIVLVGFTGLGLLDFITIPTGERMPGIEAHAQLLENILTLPGSPGRHSSGRGNFLAGLTGLALSS